MLFIDVYKKFKIYVNERHKKQGSITILNTFENNILLYFKDYHVSDITKLDLLNWQDLIIKKNFSNKYNANIFYCFRLFYNYMFDYNYISDNIFIYLKPFPKHIEYKNVNIYSFHQFKEFFKCCDDFVIKYFFDFMFYYGTRPSETMALTFNDFKKGYIRVIHSLRRKGDRGFDSPKNQSSIRCFKISLFAIFKIYLLRFYYFHKYGYFDSNFYIFGGKSPLSPSTIDRVKLRAIKKAKLPYITQHGFRHSFATRMIHKKVCIDIVSRNMGHSKVSTTLDIYLHNEKNTFSVFNS